MINLFIDCSRKTLAIALLNDNGLIDSIETSSHGKHSNYLMSSLNNIFKDNNLKINDVDNIIVVNGPGSFTGIRVGVTVAKTLAWTLSKNLYEITTLDALKTHTNNDVVISVFYDKPNASYVGIYDNNKIIDYMTLDDTRLDINNKKITIISYDENDFVKALKGKLKNCDIDFVVLDNYDYVKVVNSALKTKPVVVHNSAPVYLKKIDAEK